ncbi:hypothetical protein [Streptomyces sp. NBC_01304]|uniref:hypothetical protein n=1 Tax=Streptomyces sp. NBC_01304 TaxID=2903818 RepID=UPI002E0F3FC1|nr:hypothetical protein OG430_48980 [Streptomyces sp. NBC_01304]
MGDNTPIWQWPLYSVRRLVGTLLVLAALVVAVGVLISSSSGGRPSGAPAPGPATNSPSPSPSPSASPSPSLQPSQDLGQAIEVAKAFVTAWASHADDQQVWYAGAAQYATDRMAKKLTTVDRDNVPATKIDGKSRLTDTGGVGRTEVAVDTDAGMVSVVLVQDGKGGWQVDDLQPGAQAVE